MVGGRGHWTRGSLSVAVALRLSAAPPLPTQRAPLDPSLMHEKESDTDHATTSSPLKDSDDNRMDGEPRADAEEGKNQSGETDTGAARGDVAAMEKQQSSPKDNDGDVVMANGGGSDDNEEEEDNDEEEEEEKSVKQEEPKQQQPQQPPSTNGEHRNGEEKKSDDKPKADMTGSAPPPPVMKGTLSYDIDQRRHLIRGMWNYENSTVFPPQRFELLRNLSPSEDLKKLPQDGEFHGSFSLAYFHTTSKGKQKERSKVIPESGVKIKFTPDSDGDGYKVDGTGTNQFGIFHINGTAKPSPDPADPTLNIVLRKRYEPSATAAEPVPEPVKTNSGKLITAAVEEEGGPLPPPSKSFPSGVVCLRGKLYKEESTELGLNEVIHRINGMWASGLDFLLSDPGNTRGLANRFEYEHKSSVPSHQFPVSGRYSGWFDLSNDDGSRTRINERDVTLKFRSNNAGYHNVEGKGSNVFGKYSITGTLTADNVLTIFRHFQPRKLKTKSITLSTAAPPAAPRASLTQPGFEPKLKLEDVKVPDGNGQVLEPLTSPEHSLYSAVSRGILRLNDDGSHSCQGKWAVTREHFTSGMTSNFNFRLEAHFTAEALTAMKAAGAKDTAGQPRQFPVDSAMYKGSFQLKKQGSRYQTIVDQQVVMKFRPNTLGSYNVYGKGVNAIGEFNLIGTMVMSGKTGGQVELYRVYPPDKMAAPVVPKTTAPAPVVPKLTREGSVPSLPSAPPSGPLQRRESTRLVKLPSKLEDDDPSALLTRTMNKCSQILRLIREKDVELGAFFSEPVDPVVLGIPTYHQIIKEPMDLRTVHRRMEAGSIEDPEEFARLVRLVFENAMTFNIDPAHSVHQAARTLLVLFNQKFRDVERMMQNIKRAQDGDKKGDKKRKRLGEELKSPKRRRLEEAQAMAAANASAVAAIVAAAPPTSSTTVTRSEFNMLLNLIQQLQKQIVQTHTAVAELSPGDDNDAMSVTSVPMSVKSSSLAALPPAPAPAPERKKPVKRKSEQAMSEPPVSVDDSRPLTLDEQELLTETINELPPEHLGGIIQIIREAAPVGADEDEIDLEIDQLDTKTQRKLLRHVSKVSIVCDATSFAKLQQRSHSGMSFSLSRNPRLKWQRKSRRPRRVKILRQLPKSQRRLRSRSRKQPLSPSLPLEARVTAIRMTRTTMTTAMPRARPQPRSLPVVRLSRRTPPRTSRWVLDWAT